MLKGRCRTALNPASSSSSVPAELAAQRDKGDMGQERMRTDQNGELFGVHICHAGRTDNDFLKIRNILGKKAGYLASGSDDPYMPNSGSAEASSIHGGAGFLFGKKNGGKKGG